MTLPKVAPQRQLKHRRSIDVQVYARGDGLWEVDATLVDVKTREIQLRTGPLPAGVPVHDMLLRLVVDEKLNIVEAGSETRGMPYKPHCTDHGDAYQRLVGLNLARGFRKHLQERVGGVLGCTHLTELAQTVPTAVIQAFAGEVFDTRGDHHGARQPFQLGRCHALRVDGPAVQTYFARWYRAPKSEQPDPSVQESEP